MAAISTVIITKNEAGNIEACIRSASTVSDDIVVVDCGSEDATVALAVKAGARVIEIAWQCYGHSRNTGAAAARHNWILSLDADERVSPGLAETLRQISLNNVGFIYKIKRENFFAQKRLKFGTPGFEKIARLYNRTTAQWDLFPVHERLQTTAAAKRIHQPILHFGITSLPLHLAKWEEYAYLNALKYKQQQKRATLVKRFLAPVFNGAKSYIFQAGFLDGKKGWQVAATIFYYTWLKYRYLHQMTAKSLAVSNKPLSPVKMVAGTLSTFFAKR